MSIYSVLATLWSLFVMANAVPSLRAKTVGASSEIITSGRTVYQFANGTWVENIASRANGNLLVTLIDRPELYEINPRKENSARLIHRFEGYTSLFGLSEISKDVFAVAIGNFSLAKGTVPKSFSIWKVALSSQGQANVHVAKVVDMPDAIFLNGMTTLRAGSNAVLVADCTQGVVYHVNINTGKYSIVLRDKSFLPTPNAAFPIGINGIRLYGEHLYYSNTAMELFGRIQVNPSTGAATGPYTITNLTFEMDDFAINDRDQTAYLAAGGINEMFKMRPSGQPTLFAGRTNSTLVEGATSVVFGRTWEDKDVLYVTTSGGQASILDGISIEGGKVVALSVDC